MQFTKLTYYPAFLAFVVVCWTVVAFPQVSATAKASDDIAVVVNVKNTLTDLSGDELRKILLGDKRYWKGSLQVSLVLRQPGTRELDQVLAVLLKMSSSDFEKYWRAKVFRGEATSEPLSVPSNGMVGQFVVDTPGAVSFVIGKNLRPDVKIVKIDGKLPGEAGYLLK